MKYRLLFTLWLVTLIAWAQSPVFNRSYTAVRTEEKPKIDGDLSDMSWCMAADEFNGKFTQIWPDNGEEDKNDTRFLIVYDDKAIYIAAELYDENPEEIPMELATRDNLRRNSDYFGIVLDTYNKGQNGVGFFVSSSGVQTDMVYTSRDDDRNWDAVWKSAVKVTERGWNVEIEIPYQAIRFPDTEIQEWGMNLIRRNRRLGIETSWNFVDRQQNGFLNQAGKLNGLKNIDPPVRLSLMPYVSAVYQGDKASGNSNVSFNGGMDIKYGINESFTLDMTLIPDFSNVRSDNQVLNLSPFEVRYSENRPFFTEGTELFNIGGLFYSRRVGQKFRRVSDQELGENEIIISEPTNAPLINASKVSGRTVKGLGVGVFNGMSRNSIAYVRDTITGIERDLIVDPFTNFNVAVLDQNLKNNSRLSFINTNVYRGDRGRNANVSLGQVQLRDKSNTWSFYSQFGYSHQADTILESNERRVNTGYKYTLYFSKVAGNFQFNLGRNIESDTWDINDLGYMRAANEISHNMNLKYNIYKPFAGIFNSMYSNLEFRHQQLYDSKAFQNFNTSARVRFQFVNFWDFNYRLSVSPVAGYDYWEPRVAGRKFIKYPAYNMNFSVGTDGRKPFRVGMYNGYWVRKEDGATATFFGVSPRYRANDKFTVSGNLNYDQNSNSKGYVSRDDELSEIYFGNRDVKTITSELRLQYTFTNKMGLSLRTRNYWSRVEYDQFFDLQLDGTLDEGEYQGVDGDGNPKHDRDFTVFNLDLIYSWQIAPGSFLNVTYKQQTANSDVFVSSGYFRNLENTLQTPGNNTLSVKLIYFLDYATLFGA